MLKTKNVQINKQKFMNFNKKVKSDTYFYILPTCIISKKKLIEWNLFRKTYFLGFLKYNIQINCYKRIYDETTILTKSNMNLLVSIFTEYNKKITNIEECVDFLNRNHYIISILKNGERTSPYFNKLIMSYFENCNFLD